MRFDPNKLREARGDRPRGDLARAVKKSRDTIRRWERGQTEPDASDLGRLAELLGWDLRDFFSAVPPANEERGRVGSVRAQ